MKSQEGIVNDVFDEKTTTSVRFLTALQHILTMVPGTIAVPIILASGLNLDAESTSFLIAASLLTSAIATALQVYSIIPMVGSRLPIVLGSAFAPLGAMIMIGNEHGLATMFGSVIGAGFLMFAISMRFDRIVQLFPPVVVGSFVTLIGIYLAPLALANVGGGYGNPNFGSIDNLFLGFLVLIITLFTGHFGKGFIKNISLLVGIVAGTIISVPFGMLDLTGVNNAPWFAFITPFHFGLPEFHLPSIIILTIFCITNFIQCIGVYSIVGELYNTNITITTKVNGLRAVALSQIISGGLNSSPSTMFNENVGLLKITGVKSRRVIQAMSLLLIVLALCPKFSMLITAIPNAVIGGATLALFGVITSAGIAILSTVKLNENNNFTIIGTSISVGVGATFSNGLFDSLPASLGMLLSNGLFMVCFTAILLNTVFNYKKESNNE
ncbi:uracil-xanthine permease family protein [Photobacterium satsumensis]|uniref:uracil-xanthine permease family protein n=1 Tax=Photobacterium satsumensis TaxID=2910239 RepID=UPI003D10A3AA